MWQNVKMRAVSEVCSGIGEVISIAKIIRHFEKSKNALRIQAFQEKMHAHLSVQDYSVRESRWRS